MAPASGALAVSDGLTRRAVFRALRGLRGGSLVLREERRRFGFGEPGADLRAEVEVLDPRAYRWLLRGSTGWGEGYVEGLWTSPDPVALARLASRNLPSLDRWRRRLHPLLGPLQRTLSLVPRNTRVGSRANISAHYDLGNELFESFLDERMMYSCALFEAPATTLEQAQRAKLERICARLELDSSDHLLEIGGGWGGLAIHAAATRGCRVTTVTISAEQHAYATRRVHEAGLDERVEVALCDYRDLTGTYDKLVSIEMIEAVGWQYFDVFFERCGRLLRPDGAMFLQAIVIDDDVYELEKASRSFANTHVFPGGCLPCARVIERIVAKRTDMRPVWFSDITEHYPPTLRAWRQRFNEAWPELRNAYDERFRRLWNIYLALSEGGFRERRIGDIQYLLAKPEFAGAGGNRLSGEAGADEGLVAA